MAKFSRELPLSDHWFVVQMWFCLHVRREEVILVNADLNVVLHGCFIYGNVLLDGCLKGTRKFGMRFHLIQTTGSAQNFPSVTEHVSLNMITLKLGFPHTAHSRAGDTALQGKKGKETPSVLLTCTSGMSCLRQRMVTLGSSSW